MKILIGAFAVAGLIACGSSPRDMYYGSDAGAGWDAPVRDTATGGSPADGAAGASGGGSGGGGGGGGNVGGGGSGGVTVGDAGGDGTADGATDGGDAL